MDMSQYDIKFILMEVLNNDCLKKNIRSTFDIPRQTGNDIRNELYFSYLFAAILYIRNKFVYAFLTIMIKRQKNIYQVTNIWFYKIDGLSNMIRRRFRSLGAMMLDQDARCPSLIPGSATTLGI